MKTLSLMTSAWLALVAAPAAAADMPAPPPVVPAYTWSGCYAGIHAGGEWTSQSFRNSTTLADYGGNKASGGAAGGQLGCDYQMGVLVLGVQGMIDATNARSDNSLPASTNVITTKVDWLTTFTGRIGVTATPAALLYAKGGAAWINDVHGIRNPAGTTLLNGQAIRSGWTAGVGLEWGFGRNLSVFVEYDYADFGARGVTLTPPGGGANLSIGVAQNVNMFLVGGNVRFGPGAVAASD